MRLSDGFQECHPVSALHQLLALVALLKGASRRGFARNRCEDFFQRDFHDMCLSVRAWKFDPVFPLYELGFAKSSSRKNYLTH